VIELNYRRLQLCKLKQFQWELYSLFSV